MRLRPASSAAARKLSNERVTPGSVGEVTENESWSPKKRASTSAPAALIVLCAPGYEGSAGGGMGGGVAGGREPGRIGDGGRVDVGVGEIDRRDGPPQLVRVLRVVEGDRR